jgi:hypothetical protein
MNNNSQDPDGVVLESQEMTLLSYNKESGYKYRYRRQEEWRENYTLYRDRVLVNRLTQRQSVNVPLMKTQIKTLLTNVDDLPVIVFENLDNDKEKEVLQNEHWKYTLDCNNAELQDIVDKKQVFMYGRSFDQWQIIDGEVRFFIEDPEDILVDRYCDPTNIDSSRFLIHTHIFRPLSTLRQNKDYDQGAVDMLETWYKSQNGLIKEADNQKMLVEKNQRLSDMGVSDIDNPILGETVVELSIHFCYPEAFIGNDGVPADEGQQLYMYVEAENMLILMKKPLEEVIGVTTDHYWRTHFPYNTWADDIERTDFWSDGIADILRTPNKVLNSWFSQLIENRQLRNYGMNFYDGTKTEQFNPNTFQPQAWGFYSLPGKPQDVLMPVPVPDLKDSLDEMNFIMGLSEKATGATATEQGAKTEQAITLGEVQLALSKAEQRIKGMSLFYTKAWEQRAKKYLKLVEAGKDKLNEVTFAKKGRNTSNIYTREASPKDWMTDKGYQTKIWSQEDKNTQDTNSLQKLSAARAAMPMNPKLNEIYDRKILEFADLTPDEVTEIIQAQQEIDQQMQNPMGMPGMPPGQPQPGGGGMPMPPPQGAPAPMAPTNGMMPPPGGIGHG